MQRDILIQEYKAVRGEVADRAKMLHGMLTNAAFMQFIAAVLYFTFLGGMDSIVTVYFLLTLPVVFAALCFNYQANQMTLEQLAHHSNNIRQRLTDKDDDRASWDEQYGRFKKKYQLTSFLKVLPLLLPFLIPYILLLQNGGFFDDASANRLVVIDTLIFALVIFNFRYKWHRD
ncbi:MAG: hypothetical protein ACAH35_04965 [Candidatus Paceibacterota bacterium]